MEDNKKNARIFYLTLAVVLAVVAVLVVATVVARRTSTNPTESSSTDDNDDKQTINELPDFILPVEGKISYDFSDTVQVMSPTMGDWRTHNGVDIDASIGSEVLAVADGVVTDIKNDDFMGTSIFIEHEGNAISIYRNLSSEIKDGIVIGSTVKSGDVIGYVGETAKNEIAQEPHLHYELTIGGKHVDPKEHLPFKNDVPQVEDSSSEQSKTDDSSSDNQ